ncbi:uncharacterized protein LOC131691527 [Topomyia yanbarensis]|uniref:uncharacterized protein LOC131691527 n=1 Tax=Topomyia yanbarensis TaxID=2498891 RepID=UPI00273C0984|nr:uncharacterized protein LOC131691527 [Topomyia yanbarensis]
MLASRYAYLKMIRSNLALSVVMIAVLVGAVNTSGRLLENWKTRRDERIVRRHRLRELAEFAPTIMFGLQDQANTLPSNNITHHNHNTYPVESPHEDYHDVEISESDLTEAALGQYRTAPRRTIFEQNVIFRFYNGGNLTKTTTINKLPLLKETSCSTTQKFAIIVHGWRENCYETFWIKDLEINLNIHRGGCIICVDYSTFASNNYPYLFKRFNDLSAVLLKFLRTLQYEGLQFDNLYMFGFSFGGQLVLDAGNQIGYNAIESIDTCDMAGVGFDQDRFFKGIHFRNAAKNVQCIHTSTDKGTKLMDKCHQDWRMGQCGFRQPAAGKPPLGSHGLCPVFYNLAFKVKFLAEQRPPECTMLREPTAEYPNGFRMGYLERRKGQVRGELYAQTTDRFPFTVFNDL